jgi:hypothetical protein
LNYLKLEKIKFKDKAAIFKWRNTKIVNKYLLIKKIKKKEHNKWFDKTIKSRKYTAWVIKYFQKNVGLAKIDKTKYLNVCNAGFYLVKKKYSFLTFEIMHKLHELIFIKFKFKKIYSYISKNNKNFRKLNELNGYKEIQEVKKNSDFILTSLSKKDWLKSRSYNYLIKKYGKI